MGGERGEGRREEGWRWVGVEGHSVFNIHSSFMKFAVCRYFAMHMVLACFLGRGG